MNVKRFLKLYTSIVADVIKKFEENPIGKQPPRDLFASTKEPAIPLVDYLARLNMFSLAEDECNEKCSEEIFVIALIYLDRLINSQSLFPSRFNIHRLIGLAFCIAIKLSCDVYFNNPYLAQVLGISLDEFNKLEVEFCYISNFDFYISDLEYNQYTEELNKRLISDGAGQQALLLQYERYVPSVNAKAFADKRGKQLGAESKVEGTSKKNESSPPIPPKHPLKSVGGFVYQHVENYFKIR